MFYLSPTSTDPVIDPINGEFTEDVGTTPRTHPKKLVIRSRVSADWPVSFIDSEGFYPQGAQHWFIFFAPAGRS